MGDDNVYMNVPTAVLAFDERAHDELLSEDLGAVAARIGNLTRVVKRHGSELTDGQRSALADASSELDNLETGDPS